jgi:hypothetical protein
MPPGTDPPARPTTLRNLQSAVEIGAGKNTTVVFPPR